MSKLYVCKKENGNWLYIFVCLVWKYIKKYSQNSIFKIYHVI